jgi:hypothetical protein
VCVILVGGHLRPRCIFFSCRSICRTEQRDNTPHTFRSSHVSSPISLRPLTTTIGWLMCPPIWWWPSKPNTPSLSLFSFFWSLNSTPQTMGKRPTPLLWPSAPLHPPLTLRRRQPLVSCCVDPSSGGHLRPGPHPSLSFLMGAILATQTSESTPVSASLTAHNLRTLIGEQRRNDLGETLPCPWRERGKAAGE